MSIILLYASLSLADAHVTRKIPKTRYVMKLESNCMIMMCSKQTPLAFAFSGNNNYP